jgi:hypothetical protein
MLRLHTIPAVLLLHLLQPQVWESTPGFGEAPFLDTLWTAIDEVTALTCKQRQH